MEFEEKHKHLFKSIGNSLKGEDFLKCFKNKTKIVLVWLNSLGPRKKVDLSHAILAHLYIFTYYYLEI